MHIPYDLIGARAVRYLLHILDEADVPYAPEWVRPHLVFRDSAAPPRSGIRTGPSDLPQM